MLGASEHSEWIDRRLLSSLLDSGDDVVANAALAAIRWPDDAELFDDVVGHLDNRPTAGAAVDALARTGNVALDFADRGLRGHYRLGQYGHEQLARVCRMVGGSSAVSVLRHHVDHRDREVGLAVMTSLAAISPADLDSVDAGVTRRSSSTRPVVLRALLTLENTASAGVLRSALSDELELLRRRVVAGLAVHYGAEELSRVGFQLAQRNARHHALALEWLDVTLVGIDRAAVALLEPELTHEVRLARLTRWFPISPTTPQAVVVDIAEDNDGRWRRPWITACALLAAEEMPELEIKELTGGDGDEDTQIVWETVAAIRHRRSVQLA